MWNNTAFIFAHFGSLCEVFETELKPSRSGLMHQLLPLQHQHMWLLIGKLSTHATPALHHTCVINLQCEDAMASLPRLPLQPYSACK
jgi:hypothetical protein